MKILVVAPTPFFSDRGCHIRILDQVSHLQKRKHEVKILTYHIGKNIAGLDIERIPNFFWYRRLDSDASWHKIYLDLFLLLKTILTIIRYKPDVVHCHLHEGALVGILLRPFTRGLIIFDCQGSLSEELVMGNVISGGGYANKILLFVEKVIYKYSRNIIVSSLPNLGLLVNRFSVPRKNLHYIPDGIDPTEVRVSARVVASMKKKYNVPSDKKVIVYLGSLSAAHGIDDIIAIASELFSVRKDLFWVVGGYPNQRLYEQIVRKNGLSEAFSFCGRVSSKDIFNFLQLGNFAIVLKKYRSQGNLKLLHYALAKLPIICSDLPYNKTIIGDLGLYIPIDKPTSYKARLLSKYLDYPKKFISRRGQALYDLAIRDYDLNKIAASVEEVYAGKS